MEERFLQLLPKIETHGKIFFRHIKCRQSREEAIAEMVALAWQWFKRLYQRGKDPGEFVYNFTRCLVRAVSAGRRVTGMLKTKDVMSPRCQQMRGFKVESLPMSSRTSHENLYAEVHGQRDHDAFEERLQDNRMTPVPEQAAFRIDFPVWLKSWSERDKRIIADMMKNERTFDLSKKYGCSPGRISQKREQYHRDWDRFNGEPVSA